jgi:hypothetical protein
MHKPATKKVLVHHSSVVLWLWHSFDPWCASFVFRKVTFLCHFLNFTNGDGRRPKNSMSASSHSLSHLRSEYPQRSGSQGASHHRRWQDLSQTHAPVQPQSSPCLYSPPLSYRLRLHQEGCNVPSPSQDSQDRRRQSAITDQERERTVARQLR